MILGRREIIRKLIDDTQDGKLKWNVKIDRQWVRAEYSISVTPNKILFFKLVYYTDHPNGTKLFVTYNVKSYKGVTVNHDLYSIGGKKKRAESKEMLNLMNKILLKEEEHRSVTDNIQKQILEYKPGPFELEIGDRVIVGKDPEFDIAEGMEGTIVSEVTDTDDTFYYLVDFEDPFYEQLVFSDFDFEKEDFKIGGTCWPFEPEFLKKIVEREDEKENEKLLFSFAEFAA